MDYIKKIKDYLKKKGKLKCETLTDKIEYLIYNIDKLNLYSDNFTIITLSTLEANIISYNILLTKLLKVDLSKDYLENNTITIHSYYKVDLILWYSNNGYFFKDNKSLLEFFNNVKELLKKYELLEELIPIMSYNKRKLRPIINNVEEIIEIIYKIKA